MTEHEIDILARTLYGEARGDYPKVGVAAFIAVANVIMNRFKGKGRYGHTLLDVCLKPRQFSCWNSTDPNRQLIQGEDIEKETLFQIAKKTAMKVALGIWPDLTLGSDHYHAIYCKPAWAKHEKLKMILGRHIFYKLG
jgi:N-acetylmuramoyl-L-alanine amidase